MSFLITHEIFSIFIFSFIICKSLKKPYHICIHIFLHSNYLIIIIFKIFKYDIVNLMIFDCLEIYDVIYTRNKPITVMRRIKFIVRLMRMSILITHEIFSILIFSFIMCKTLKKPYHICIHIFLHSNYLIIIIFKIFKYDIVNLMIFDCLEIHDIIFTRNQPIMVMRRIKFMRTWVYLKRRYCRTAHKIIM